MNDPDLQDVVLTSIGTTPQGTQNYDELIDNDYDNYYNGVHNYYEVKEFQLPDGSITKVLDLRSSSPIKLCQVIYPVIEQPYNLIFNVYFPSITQSTDLEIHLNDSIFTSIHLNRYTHGNIILINVPITFNATPLEFCLFP